jgi:purine catabolism regulator
MYDAADERTLPVLITAYQVPFSTVERAVTEANRSEEHARLLQKVRLYETVHHAAASASGPELLLRLERIVDCDLCLVDHRRGLV